MALSLDSIKSIVGASGLQIDKVVKKSDGTVLWSRSTPYYAIQNGKLVNCPNASAWYGGYLAAQSGECSYNGVDFYGGNSHVSGSDDITHHWGADTGTMQTQGCKYLTVKTYLSSVDSAASINATFNIYGDGAVIATPVVGANSGTTERTIDISAYTTVRVYIDVCIGEDYGCYPACGLIDVQFHD